MKARGFNGLLNYLSNEAQIFAMLTNIEKVMVVFLPLFLFLGGVHLQVSVILKIFFKVLVMFFKSLYMCLRN